MQKNPYLCWSGPTQSKSVLDPPSAQATTETACMDKIRCNYSNLGKYFRLDSHKFQQFLSHVSIPYRFEFRRIRHASPFSLYKSTEHRAQSTVDYYSGYIL